MNRLLYFHWMFQAEKPSQIDYQNGGEMRLELVLGFDAQVNRFVFNTIQPMEKREGNLN